MRFEILVIIHTVVIISLWDRCRSVKPKLRYLRFGGIFDHGDVYSKTGFLYGVSQYNNNQWKKFKLSGFAEIIDVKDSFKLAASICSQMSVGVFLIFGARPSESANVVESYTQTFHIPYVSPSSADPAFSTGSGSDFQLHIKPSHTMALVGLIRHFQWRTFHYVYDSEDGLYRIQEMMRMFEQKRYITHNIRIRRLEDPKNAHEDLRALDKTEGTRDENKFDNTTEKLIVLDLSTETAYSHVMRQIREVGMNKEGYKYILGTVDFLNLEMERYMHGGVNITGFQLVNYTSAHVKDFMEVWGSLDPNVWVGAGGNTIHIDAALSVDAITLIHMTLSDLIARSSKIFKTTFRRGKVYNHNRTEGVPCDTDPPVPWMHGEALIRGMKRLKFEGVTGNVEFDEHGYRKSYKFDIYNVGLNHAPFKIGDWSSDHGIGFARDNFKGKEEDNTTSMVYIVTTIELDPTKDKEFPIDSRCQNRTIRQRHIYGHDVTKDSPFVMTKEQPKNGNPKVGDDQIFEGYVVDLAKEVAAVVKFEYKLKLVKDGKYGECINNKTDDWNGMIGELVNNVAHMAIAPLSITSDREEVVDFSKPFMNVGISIMIKKPEKKKPGVFSFMQPFTLELWMCIVFGYFSVSIGIFFVSRLSSSEWRRPRCRPNVTYNKFTLPNSLWFAMGSMMLQGSDDTCPRSSPGRIIGGAWWFAVLITISSYTANLAAFLTIEKLLTPIEGADDLVNQNEIAYGTLNAGSTKAFFKKSRVSTYKSMWNFMDSTKPSVMVQNLDEGIKRVRNSKGKYAFLLESVYNDYFNNQKPCNTMKVGVNLNSNHYGIATQKYSPLRRKLVYNDYLNNQKPCNTMKVGVNLNSNHYGIVTQKYSPLRDEITLAVLSLTEAGTLSRLKKKWWVDRGACGFDTGHRESKKRSLSLSNVAGAYFILIGGLVFSIIVGVVEFIFVKAKPERLQTPEGESMLPVADTIDTFPDTNGTDSHNVFHKMDMPASPVNGAARQINHFTYEPPAYSSPKTYGNDMNTNTAV